VATLLRVMFGFILFFLLLLSPAYLQSTHSLDDVLKRVGDNMQVLKDTLPDFECRETVRQRMSYKKGQQATIRTVESILRAAKSPQGAFTEQREYKSIDGKQLSKDEKVPEGLTSVVGVFANLLFLSFSSSSEIKITGVETIQNRQALALIFSTVKGQNERTIPIAGKLYSAKTAGKVWLDPDSMQVIRCEMKQLDVPAKWNPGIITVDYAIVHIAGTEFWMPKSIKYLQSAKKGDWNYESYGEYTEYRKFDVSTRIIYEPTVQQ
jgi:hypothetical protein